MLQLVHGSNDTSPGRPVLMYHRYAYTTITTAIHMYIT